MWSRDQDDNRKKQTSSQAARQPASVCAKNTMVNRERGRDDAPVTQQLTQNQLAETRKQLTCTGVVTSFSQLFYTKNVIIRPSWRDARRQQQTRPPHYPHASQESVGEGSDPVTICDFGAVAVLLQPPNLTPIWLGPRSLSSSSQVANGKF